MSLLDDLEKQYGILLEKLPWLAEYVTTTRDDSAWRLQGTDGRCRVKILGGGAIIARGVFNDKNHAWSTLTMGKPPKILVAHAVQLALATRLNARLCQEYSSELSQYDVAKHESYNNGTILAYRHASVVTFRLELHDEPVFWLTCEYAVITGNPEQWTAYEIDSKEAFDSCLKRLWSDASAADRAVTRAFQRLDSLMTPRRVEAVVDPGPRDIT